MIFVKVAAFIVDLIEKIGTVLLVIMTLSIFAQVINRTFFKGAFYWAEPAAILCMNWIALLASVSAVHYGHHTRIDFFFLQLSPEKRKILETINYIICAVFLVVLAYNSLPIIKISMHKTIISIPFLTKCVYYLPILIGGTLMMIYYLLQAILIWIEVPSTSKAGE